MLSRWAFNAKTQRRRGIADRSHSSLCAQRGRQSWSRAWSLWLGGLAVLLLSALPALPAAAHGGGAPQLTAAPAGPYRLFAWTTPEPWRVGEAHTTVAVTQPDAEGRDTPITGAQVTVVYAAADGASQPIRTKAVEGSGAQAGFYEADATLSTAGAWQVTILVSGPAGSGEAAFAYSVLPAESGVNWSLVGLGVGALVLVVGIWLAALWSRRRGARPGSQQPAGSL